MKNTNQILAHFVEFDIASIFSFGKGHINHTYLCEVQKGGVEQKYILQKINQNVFEQPERVMENMVAIGQHIKEKSDYPLLNLMPIAARSGDYFVLENKGYWRLLPFIENTITYSKAANPDQAYQAAKGYGKFIKVLFDFPIEKLHLTIPNFHNSTLRMLHLNNAIKEASENRKHLAKETIQYILQEAEVFDWIDSFKLPLRVTHNDTKIDNVLMHKETQKAVCVIDLDTVMPGSLLSDFGDMVRTFTNSEEEDAPNLQDVALRAAIFEALSVGFLEELSDVMSETEKEHLLNGAKWIILEQAVRFLADFLQNDVYYKTQYDTHNLVRAKNQIALYQSLLYQETKLIGYIHQILQTN